MSNAVLPQHAAQPATPTDTLPTRWAAADGAMSPGRFLLYVSYACPWSHRVLIARALNGLEDAVEVVDVEPEMDELGWRLEGSHLADRYRTYVPGYAGKASVPLMVEVAAGQVVSNESADLTRMLGTLIRGSGEPLFPAVHAAACDAWNDDIQMNVNKRIYQFGFGATDEEKIIKTRALMETFLRLNHALAKRVYLVTDEAPLEPDWRLLTTLARYDLAYRPFMLSADAVPLAAFTNLARFCAELLAVPGISATYRPDEIARHYSARLRDFKPGLSNHHSLQETKDA